MNNYRKSDLCFARNVISFLSRQISSTRYVQLSSTSHADIHGKFRHDLCYKVDKSSAWNFLERKWINIPTKHRTLRIIPWKQQKATWAQSNHFNVAYNRTIKNMYMSNYDSRYTWANTIEEFAYNMTTSNLNLLVFDTSRKSTQISRSLILSIDGWTIET